MPFTSYVKIARACTQRRAPSVAAVFTHQDSTGAVLKRLCVRHTEMVTLSKLRVQVTEIVATTARYD